MPQTQPPFHYERLAAESASFLLVEDERRYLHSITTQIFEPGPLAQGERGVDISAIHGAVEAVLPQLPRYRQRLRWIPFEDYPVWVDDRDFRLDYHLRHTALPAPGGMDQLSRFVGRVMSQRLDRSRPLWECWVVEGLEGGRFALVSKSHHCLLDEGTERDLLGALLSADAGARPEETSPWVPRPAPSRLELGREELLLRARFPRGAGQRYWSFAQESGSVGQELRRRAVAVARLSGFVVREKSPSPFAVTTGSHRRVEHLELALDDAIVVHRAFDASVSDVLLALVAGAVRSFLQTRFMNSATLDLRVAMPIRVEGEDGAPATARWVIELPIWEPDPARRIEHVREQTARLRAEHATAAASTLFGAAEWSGSRLLSMGARRLAAQGAADLSLHYVPGSERTLHLCGARLVASYGQTPLRPDSALAITVLSCEGRLCFGFNADPSSMRDLETLRDAARDELARLLGAAHGALRMRE